MRAGMIGRKAAVAQAERELLKAQAEEDRAWERGVGAGVKATEARLRAELRFSRVRGAVAA